MVQQIRVAGVLWYEKKLLVHRLVSDNFWALPGGRVEKGELSHNALQREWKEELQVNIQLHQLLWVMENQFEYNQQTYHEIGFYYHISLDADSYLPLNDFETSENGIHFLFHWLPFAQIAPADLRPNAIRHQLVAPLSQQIVHIF